MISTNLRLVAVSGDTWQTWPASRPLALLVKDAKAMERRAAKGVNVGVERGLFLQLARRIDIRALSKPGEIPALCLRDAQLRAYLALHGALFLRLRALEIPGLKPFFAAEHAELQLRLYASTFFAPDEAKVQEKLFRAVKPEKLAELCGLPAEARRLTAEVVRLKTDFYRQAVRRRCGVVEVMNLDQPERSI